MADNGSAPRRPAVLVVNDRVNQRVAMRSMLVLLNVEVVEADSGRAALRAVLGQDFAVILMDVRMPSVDGYETADLIRQRDQSSRTPIIFVTAFGREDHPQTVAAYASGAVDFLFTPVVPDVLRAKVSVFVDLFVKSRELQRSLDSIKTLNGALRDSQASTQAVLDNVTDGIVTAGHSGLIESLNPAARALFGYREAEVIGQPLSLIIAPEERDAFRSLTTAPSTPRSEGDAQNRASETFGRRRDGSRFAMEIEHSKTRIGDRSLTLAFVRDISARQAYTKNLEHLALHDGLTGLANRKLFGELVLQGLASAHRNDEPRALLMMDLDGFKQVNDMLGHDRGDRLLEQVAQRLRGAVRESDTIARLGGDEFAILANGATDLAAAVTVALKIEQTCAKEFTIDGEACRVSASIGIAMFPEHGTTMDQLLRRADAAMYLAKRSASAHAVFDPSQETHSAQELALLTDMHQCIARDQLILHYQPKIDLATREITGVEALVRWQHPRRGLLEAATFMPELERTELIEQLTRWVLNEALHQQRIWRDQGVDLTMAVNISGHSLGQGSDLPRTVAELTDTWGTAPGRLTLELTEGSLVETAAPEILDQLHSMGEIMSIDDFGTGYSSLAYLQRLPVDEIKIDRSFVTSLAAASHDEVIVGSTVDLAHNLGLTVVAEGVEDQNAMDLLVTYGCDGVQGYFFSRPCPADELTKWLTESPYGMTARASDQAIAQNLDAA
jgi:diguanylate cyclase (GGDEF)-like protein/PAS domain S-box-containing protein